MCVIAFCMPGAELTKKRWDTCWSANPDGGGYVFNKDNKLTIVKSMDREYLYAQYKRDFDANKENPFLIHFRIGTRGTKDISNCHPFWATEDKTVAFVHNGVLDIDCLKTEDHLSDTHVLSNLMTQTGLNIMNNTLIDNLVDEICGRSNKMVFLDVNDMYYIINETHGFWVKPESDTALGFLESAKEGSIWFSNRSFENYAVHNTALIPSKWDYNKTKKYGKILTKCDVCGSSVARTKTVAIKCREYEEQEVEFCICKTCFRQNLPIKAYFDQVLSEAQEKELFA